MREYKGRKILKQISARLMPGDSGLPDCICEILLTEDILYVLEDEYNGEYTIHYAIPCSHIEHVEKYRDCETRNGSDGGTIAPGRYALAAFIGLIGGLIVLPNKNTSVRNAYTEYMRVICAYGADEKHQIYFSEVAGSIKGFSKAFNNTRGLRK